MKYHKSKLIRFALLILFLAAHCLQAQADATLTEEADALYQSKEWAKAADAYEPITKAEPANGRAWFRMGMSFHSMGKYERAASAMQRVAEIGKNPVVMVLPPEANDPKG